MLRVGLTGGLASGKSFVGRILAELGCLVIKADEVGHQVLQPAGGAYSQVLREFGTGVLKESGEIDRRKLASLVFGQPERLARLNAIIHPLVKARRMEIEAEFAASSPHGIAVTEAAILIETGSYREYDKLIVAVCRPEQQIQRAMERDQLTREEVLDRMNRQMPLEEKIKYADYVIDTSGTKENTREQTRAVYESLRSLTV
jgi:dephospho-CoA kinase